MKKAGITGGHGYETLGKQSPDGFKEAYFNNPTKLLVIEGLKFNGIEGIDCSPGTKDNPLSERVKIANDNNCNIFLAIHFNAMGEKMQKTAEGIETFYHFNSKQGPKLAKAVHTQLLKHTKMNDRGCKADNMLFKSGLYVLRNTKMPACLVECGFMDNPGDLILMKSHAYQLECAAEIVKGICNYFKMPYKDFKTEKVTKTKKYSEILKEVSKFYRVWESFIKQHEDYNLTGLIEKLYYTEPE